MINLALIRIEKITSQKLETEKILHIGNNQIPVAFLKAVFKSILLVAVIFAAFYLGQLAMAEQTRLFIFFHGVSSGTPTFDKGLQTHNLCDIYLQGGSLHWNCTAFNTSFRIDPDAEYKIPEGEPLDLPDWR